MRTLLVVALATGAMALTACDNNHRTDRTGTAIDRTSGAVGMQAGTSSSGTATTDTATTTDENSGTSTATATNPSTTEPGSTKTSTTQTSKSAMNQKKLHAKKKMDKKTDANKTGAYIPLQQKPIAHSTINEDRNTVSSNTVSANDQNLKPTYSSTTQNNAEAMKSAQALKDEAQAKFYEPQSLTPDKTGSTSLTGQDRNHAQATQREGALVDPTVAPKRDLDASAELPIESVDLAKFPYKRRAQFKGAMSDRLGILDERIGYLKENGTNNKDAIKSLQAKEDAAEQKLKAADRVNKSNWEGYKMEFRDQIADIERSVQSMRSVRR